MASRPIKIQSLELMRYEYPELELDVRCGSGTYIRSLGRDIARAVGTKAIMSALTRTAIGEFHLQDSLNIESLTAENVASHLQPAVRAVVCLPQLEMSEDELHRLSLGQSIEDRWQMDADEIAAIGYRLTARTVNAADSS